MYQTIDQRQIGFGDRFPVTSPHGKVIANVIRIVGKYVQILPSIVRSYFINVMNYTFSQRFTKIEFGNVTMFQKSNPSIANLFLDSCIAIWIRIYFFPFVMRFRHVISIAINTAINTYPLFSFMRRNPKLNLTESARFECSFPLGLSYLFPSLFSAWFGLSSFSKYIKACLTTETSKIHFFSNLIGVKIKLSSTVGAVKVFATELSYSWGAFAHCAKRIAALNYLSI